jgi:hypothetical protein
MGNYQNTTDPRMGESESPTVTASGKTKACDAASGAASTFQ